MVASTAEQSEGSAVTRTSDFMPFESACCSQSTDRGGHKKLATMEKNDECPKGRRDMQHDTLSKLLPPLTVGDVITRVAGFMGRTHVNNHPSIHVEPSQQTNKPIANPTIVQRSIDRTHIMPC